MPSGSKKRKAAKKKKENHSHNAPNPPSASTLYHDDAKHQDDKDSDAGEVSSPASQDHRNHQNILTEGDEEETKNEGSVVQIREFEIKGKSIENDGKIEQDASSKSYDGDSSRSSSSNSASSSDDESHNIKNRPAVKDYSPMVDSVRAADLLPETNVLVVETPMVGEITSEVNENEEQNESSTEGKVGISDPKECEVQENDDRLTPSYSSSNVPVNNGAESGKDSVTQPLLERPVQTTFWKSCCGLCELFTGSAR